MHNKEELVSIILTVYNKSPYIEDAIFSIYQQTYKNWELIILDDCSTDGSFEIAKSFVEKLGITSKCRLIKNEKNLRINNNTLKGLKLSNGEYICTLDADDFFVNSKIEKCLNFCNKHGLSMVHSDLCVIDCNGIIQTTSFNSWGHKKFSLKRTIIGGQITGSAIFLKRDLAKKIIDIGFPERGVYQDQRINVCIALLGYKMGYIDEPLVYYRKTPGSLTYNKGSINNENVLKWREKFFNMLKTELSYLDKHVKTSDSLKSYIDRGIVLCNLYLGYIGGNTNFPPLKLIIMSFNIDYIYFTWKLPILIVRKIIYNFNK